MKIETYREDNDSEDESDEEGALIIESEKGYKYKPLELKMNKEMK